MSRASNYLFFGVLAIALVLASFSAFASDEPENYFSTFYYDDFIEGEDITPTFEELDLLVFTYYGKNYTLRVLGIHSMSADIRVEKRGLEIFVNQTWSFNVDDENDYDLDVTLLYTDSDVATFKLELQEKPEPEPEENLTDGTNSTDDSTGNSSEDEDDEPETQNSGNNSPKIGPEESSANKSSSATGDVVYNMNIDINLPAGGGMGLLIIVAIVLCGFVVYKKVKIRLGKKRGEISSKKHPAVPKKDSEARKAYKKFKRKLGKLAVRTRKWVGEKIAGEEFVRKGKI